MLQQTQVAKVIPYYERFLERFPTVQTLARSSLSDVIDSWSGLGYYSRAKNLHAAAKKVLTQHSGKIPSDVDRLQTLPGIGRYTAGAIASIAYDQAAPVLDGNVLRVLCRYFGIRGDPRGPEGEKELWRLSTRLVPKDSPGDFNQALMELGALVCTPRSPCCGACPLQGRCRACALGLQERIPPPRAAPRRLRIRYVCGIIERNGSVLLARRPFGSLLPGLWEFPGGEKRAGESEPESLARSLSERLGICVRPLQLRETLTQTLSHRHIEIRAFSCRWTPGRIRPRWYQETRWVGRSDVGGVPFTAGMSRLAKKLWTN